MKRMIAALVLSAAVTAPAFAASWYFVATDAQGKCHVFTRNSNSKDDRPNGAHGSGYMSRDAAEAAMAADKDCPK